MKKRIILLPLVVLATTGLVALIAAGHGSPPPGCLDAACVCIWNSDLWVYICWPGYACPPTFVIVWEYIGLSSVPLLC